MLEYIVFNIYTAIYSFKNKKKRKNKRKEKYIIYVVQRCYKVLYIVYWDVFSTIGCTIGVIYII